MTPLVLASVARAGKPSLPQRLADRATQPDVVLTPPVGDHFGIFAWAPTCVQSLTEGARFWDLARRNREQLRRFRSQPALAGLRRLLDVHEQVMGTGFEALSGRREM